MNVLPSLAPPQPELRVKELNLHETSIGFKVKLQFKIHPVIETCDGALLTGRFVSPSRKAPLEAILKRAGTLEKTWQVIGSVYHLLSWATSDWLTMAGTCGAQHF